MPKLSWVKRGTDLPKYHYYSAFYNEVLIQIREIFPYERLWHLPSDQDFSYHRFDHENFLHKIYLKSNHSYYLPPFEKRKEHLRHDENILAEIQTLLHEYLHATDAESIFVRPNPTQEIIETAKQWAIKHVARDEYYHANHAWNNEELSSELRAEIFAYKKVLEIQKNQCLDYTITYDIEKTEKTIKDYSKKLRDTRRKRFVMPGGFFSDDEILSTIHKNKTLSEQDTGLFRIALSRQPTCVDNMIVLLQSPEILPMLPAKVVDDLKRREEYVQERFS